jgi:hypothetical protein
MTIAATTGNVSFPSGVVTLPNSSVLNNTTLQGGRILAIAGTLQINNICNIAAGVNLALATTTGTKIGTATDQLLGFFNATPVVQPSSTGLGTSGFTAGGGGNTVHAQSTFTGNVGSTAYTLSDIVAHLKNLGLIAV